MNGISVVLMCTLALVAASTVPEGHYPPRKCRYWCKTPEDQAYCCEDNQKPPNPIELRPGKCPPVRPLCPPVKTLFGGPITCSQDGACPDADLCCFDRCLEEHVCKESVLPGHDLYNKISVRG